MIDSILAHAAECQPRECCGLIVCVDGVESYRPCRNLAYELNRFEMHPADWAAAEDAGEILTVVHSHVYQSPEPTAADRVGCESSGIPWMIVSWPTGRTVEFTPSGFKAQLLGRPFVWGVFDCFTLVRDYYRETFGILIDDFGGYPSNAELDGMDLYRTRFEAAGFVEVPTPSEHDVLLLQLPPAQDASHAAIYLQDETILHHLRGRLSMRQPYGSAWREATRKILRHQSLC